MRNILMTGVAALAASWVVAACTAADKEGSDAQAALEGANKTKALYCMDLLFNQKNIDAARTECWGETYIQHNPYAPDGPEALFAFLTPFFEANPDLRIDVKRVATEGDLVWIHYNNKPTPDSLGMAVVDILRMEDGKFVEHWDVVQQVPEESANDNTMF
ncbi:nuclear transport factor 2 family protein [Marinicaulis aureus]|uniref:Nuclear transport factor 2 family protein n=1 Tax=Hyphococcus aureus TaxID=2666033 RepID=A0ABW1L0L7_9PROT